MENDSTFVAPEGVYSVTEDHKPLPVANNAPLPASPTRVSTVVVRFPPTKLAATPAFTQLLGGNKDFWKERASGPKEDGISVSSSDTPDETTSPDLPSALDNTPQISTITHDHHGLFSHPVGTKRKPVPRPKHSMRTTSSTFITRVYSMEGLSKVLQSKQGDITYLFYNSAKTVYWVETGVLSKVCIVASSSNSTDPNVSSRMLCSASRFQPILHAMT